MLTPKLQIVMAFFVTGLCLLRADSCRGQESWDFEFAGSGNPGPYFPNSTIINSSTYNPDDRFTNGDSFPGWLTVNGNPGGLLSKSATTNSMSGGWTAEWSFLGHPTGFLPTTNVLQFGDNTNLINFKYDTNGYLQLTGTSGNSSSQLPINIRDEHTYRLVRQPGASTVELYLDNRVSPALQLTPDFTSSGSRNQLTLAPSMFESAWDFVRYHSGATLPTPVLPSPAGIYIPTEVQHGAGNRTYNVNPAVNDHAVISDQPMPSLWKTGNTIKMMAARGEYEPATFVVNTDTLLQGVNVEVGQLTGAGGTLPAQTLDVQVVQPYYKRVTNWPAEIPWVLTHDPSLFTIADEPPPWVAGLPPNAPPSNFGYEKTNLLTRAAVDTPTLQPADITDRRQFWITAHIPENAKPGTYTAPVRVVPTNGPAMEMTLEVRVPNLNLLAPKSEYSVYYPAFLEGTFPASSPYAQLTETQYVNEMRDMVAHGVTNPVFYSAVGINPNGTLNFSRLEQYISLREQAGMSFQGKPLYVPDNPLLVVQRDLTPAEYASNVNYTAQIVAWAEARGYGDVYFMGNDEASGAGLAAEADSFQSIQDGGGKVWVSVLNSGFYSNTEDLLDLPVLQHPGHIMWDQAAEAISAEAFLLNPEAMQIYGNTEMMMTPEVQAAIAAVHADGNKIFSYMDPTAGQTLPELQRRFRGLGLWQVGLDGSMTWAYTHIHGNNTKFSDFNPDEDYLSDLISNFVFRGEEAPFGTLAWEGFREGVDDARYLTTLLDAMEQAQLRGERLSLVNDTALWLASLDADTADLDAARREMAWRIEILNALSGDADLDSDVDLADLSTFAASYGIASGMFWQNGDFDLDGDVDLADLAGLASNYGAGEAQMYADFLSLTGSNVPEPAGMALLAVMMKAGARPRCRRRSRSTVVV